MTTTNEVQAERQQRLDDLYRADGRENPEHPMHGLYTGLAEMHKSASRKDIIEAGVVA